MGFGLDDVVEAGLDFLGLGPDDDKSAPPFIIEEVTGTKTKIELRSRALPFRPATWDGKQRVRTQWYPGNPVATQQVLGPEEMPSTFNGRWSDRFLVSGDTSSSTSEVLVNGSGGVVKGAESLARLFDQMRIAGNTLRVQWGQEVRSGILVGFKKTYERRQDIEWEMVFDWGSRDDQVAPRAADLPDPPSILDKIQNGIDEASAVLQAVQDVTDRLRNKIIRAGEVSRRIVGQIFTDIRTTQNALNLPFHIVGQVETETEKLRIHVRDENADLVESSREDVITTTSVAALLNVENKRRTIAVANSALLASAQTFEAQVLDKLAPAPIRTIEIGEDTTLYALSIQFYGTENFANFIMKSNGLNSVIVPAGTKIDIRPRPSGANAGDDLGVGC